MRFQPFAFFSLALCTALIAPVAFGQDGVFHYVGVLGGQGQEVSSPTAIGPDGSVYGVNDYFRNRGNFRRALVWSPLTGLAPLPGTPASGTSSGAYALSRDGAVLVGVLGIAPGSSGPNAQVFRRINGGPGEVLPLRADMGTPEVSGISADGTTTIGVVNGYGGGGTAVVWHGAATAEPLSTLPGAPSAQALGVSADGSVVVGWSGRGYPFDNVPCRWVNGVVESLGLPPECSWAWARAVSADGQTVVGFGWVPGGSDRAFKWTAERGMELLGSGFADAVSVSDDGRLIGGRMGVYSVVWRDGVPYRVQDQLLPPGTVLSPFVGLSGPVIVSHDGRFIAGSERVSEGVGDAEYHAWTATLPAWFADLPPQGAACGRADLGVQGGIAGSDGVLNNNDFIVFIDLFFAGDAAADLGVQGGVAGSDGLLDNNDFVAFIGAFFGGCG